MSETLSVKVGDVFRHRDGATAVIKERKASNDGWWVEGGGGLADTTIVDTRYWTRLCPTVDDLLAWLRGQGQSVDVTMYQDAEDGFVVVLNMCTDAYARHEAPTLLAALEAAVRAVDATTPPRPVEGEGASGDD